MLVHPTIGTKKKVMYSILSNGHLTIKKRGKIGTLFGKIRPFCSTMLPF